MLNTTAILEIYRQKKLDKNIEAFIRESNMIEGEYEDDSEDDISESKHVNRGRINPNDNTVIRNVIKKGIKTEKALLKLHGLIGEYIDHENLWTGKYREVQVYIGDHTPPSPKEVPGLMKKYFKLLKDLNAYESYILFEKIHPFQDLNGRMGRLIWLYKYLEENNGQFPQLGFLKTFHYQSLKNYRYDISTYKKA